jgi:hypothetical protein
METLSPVLVPVFGTVYTFFVQRIETNNYTFPAYRVDLTQMVEVQK